LWDFFLIERACCTCIREQKRMERFIFAWLCLLRGIEEMALQFCFVFDFASSLSQPNESPT
jgi:hypothetical protein